MCLRRVYSNKKAGQKIVSHTGIEPKTSGPDVSVLPLCYDREFDLSIVLIIKNITLLASSPVATLVSGPTCQKGPICRSRASPQICLPCHACLPFLCPSPADRFRTGGVTAAPAVESSSLSASFSVSTSLSLHLTHCLCLPLSPPPPTERPVS